MIVLLLYCYYSASILRLYCGYCYSIKWRQLLFSCATMENGDLKKMCKYEGGDSKGLIVPRTIKFAELLDRVHQIGNTNIREDKICLKFSVLVASNEWKHIKIEDDDDYNSEVTPSKLAPLLVSIEDKGLTNDVVHSMHITTDSSRMGHSSVAIVESNEVTWNNTNVTDLG
ncbi:hypothetical protein Prudu_016891 [Prunus dulcis]|uniref:NB-ARC domain-containing disease resistance protein n=1 Tax=Prunus dulcis TaxID=3755 RepID=A0A4Y1RME2_PRUDU|nr:hypothetical protein Prudu_016891 [Prunus dulcis]